MLGLGNIGALAGKPVMEGKAVLFKRFADIDVFDLEIDAPDPEDVIRFCELLAPTVGGINLEDIKAPECFYIEETLRERLDVPVFHDDQHGTAIIGGAAFMDAVELTKRDISQTKVVFAGAGAAGVASARFFITLGVDPENIVMTDPRGVIHPGRDDLTEIKKQFAVDTDARTLEDAMIGANAFVGVSVAGAVTPEMVQSMADQPIVFVLANPDPEIGYAEAKAARSDVVMATGRSDYPNQVNNVLGFPFIFRGALDVCARAVSEGMKVAAAQALAALARQPVPDSVLRAYDTDSLSFGPEYLIPKPFDSRVLWTVAPAVAKAAMDEGLARAPIDNFDDYKVELRTRFSAPYALINAITTRAMEQPKRVAYPHADDLRIIRAARRVAAEGIGSPILIGRSIDRSSKHPRARVALEERHAAIGHVFMWPSHSRRSGEASTSGRPRPTRDGPSSSQAFSGIVSPNTSPMTSRLIPRRSFSPHPEAGHCGERRSVQTAGSRRSRVRELRTFVCMICATPACRCLSRPGLTQRRCRLTAVTLRSR